MNINESIILLKSKYHIPILNDDKNITQSIKLLINIDILLVLFEYQQIYASNGEIRVILYHINIYFIGLKPLNNIVYK